MAGTVGRGTTPTITIRLKQEVDLASLQQLWLTVKDGTKASANPWGLNDPDILKTWDINDLTIDSENYTVSVRLKQEDTLAFGVGRCACQLRGVYPDDGEIWGDAWITKTMYFDTMAILKDGVIE